MTLGRLLDPIFVHVPFHTRLYHSLYYVISLWAIYVFVSLLRSGYFKTAVLTFISAFPGAWKREWYKTGDPSLLVEINAELWKLKWQKLFVECKRLCSCRLFLLKIRIWVLNCNKGNEELSKRFFPILYFNPFKFRKVEILKCFLLHEYRQRLALILINRNGCTLIGLFGDHICMFMSITDHSTWHSAGSRI